MDWWTGTVTGDEWVLPDGHVDVIFPSIGEPFVAGPDTAPAPASAAAGTSIVGLRLPVGAIPTLFAVAAPSLRDRRVPIGDLWCSSATDQLEQRMAAATAPLDTIAAFGEIAALVSASREGPDPIALHTAAQIRAGQPWSSEGLSDRQHRRRFIDAIGYGPKLYERICRLQRFNRAAGRASDDVSVAQLAAENGYFDQAHLARDTALLAGCTPAELRASVSVSSKPPAD